MSDNKKSLVMVVDHQNMVIRPKDLDAFKYILSFFDDRSEVTVTIEPFVRKRTVSQNGLFHKYLSLISKSTGHSIQDVKDYIKEHYGPRNEDGNIKSSNDWTTTEANFVIERTRQEGIEMGIPMPTPEEYRTYNIK